MNHSSTGYVYVRYAWYNPLLTHVQLQWPSVTTIEPKAKIIHMAAMLLFHVLQKY